MEVVYFFPRVYHTHLWETYYFLMSFVDLSNPASRLGNPYHKKQPLTTCADDYQTSLMIDKTCQKHLISGQFGYHLLEGSGRSLDLLSHKQDITNAKPSIEVTWRNLFLRGRRWTPDIVIGGHLAAQLSLSSQCLPAAGELMASHSRCTSNRITLFGGSSKSYRYLIMSIEIHYTASQENRLQHHCR